MTPTAEKAVLGEWKLVWHFGGTPIMLCSQLVSERNHFFLRPENEALEVYQFPRAAVTKYQKTGWLKITETYRLTFLEAKSPKLKCLWTWFLLEVLFQYSLPASCDNWQSWVSLTLQTSPWSQFLPLSSHDVLPVYLSVSFFFFI